MFTIWLKKGWNGALSKIKLFNKKELDVEELNNIQSEREK